MRKLGTFSDAELEGRIDNINTRLRSIDHACLSSDFTFSDRCRACALADEHSDVLREMDARAHDESGAHKGWLS